MSLATRCPACDTVFRVVQDQLKVSEGWVRCGRCNEVFNALEGLFDLGRDSAPEGAADLPSPTVAPDRDIGGSPSDPSEPFSDPDHSLVDRLDAQLLGARRSAVGSSPSTRINRRDRIDFPDARLESDSSEDEAVEQIFGLTGDSREAATQDSPAAHDAPEFLRSAQRGARWHRPLARFALGLLAFVLLGSLTLQASHHFRDVVAAHYPATGPALASWCQLLECTIETVRRIDEISVESTSLTRAVAPDAFKLSVGLRNRGPIAIAMPSIDLTLTDSTGQLVARRVLSPRDFRIPATAMRPGAETALQLVLTAGNARVAGYTVEVFYP